MKFNMWGDAPLPSDALSKAIEFTGKAKRYGEYMRRVANEWPISCENALTDYSLNRKAWIGHAAVALALQIPENITRKAWGFLTNEQRLLANIEAARTIELWENFYRKSRGISAPVDEPLLFEWDTG